MSLVNSLSRAPTTLTSSSLLLKHILKVHSLLIILGCTSPKKKWSNWKRTHTDSQYHIYQPSYPHTLPCHLLPRSVHAPIESQYFHLYTKFFSLLPLKRHCSNSLCLLRSLLFYSLMFPPISICTSFHNLKTFLNSTTLTSYGPISLFPFIGKYVSSLPLLFSLKITQSIYLSPSPQMLYFLSRPVLHILSFYLTWPSSTYNWPLSINELSSYDFLPHWLLLLKLLLTSPTLALFPSYTYSFPWWLRSVSQL